MLLLIVTLVFHVWDIPYQCPAVVSQRAGLPLAQVSLLHREYLLMKAFPVIIANSVQVSWGKVAT
jgi:hypothetical protein